MNKTLNDFHSPRCLQCFPTQENLPTKTLNPKVTSFVLSNFSLKASHSKTAKKHLNSTQTLSKSCHDLPNRDMVDAYDPRYDQPYPQNVSNKPKIVSRFCQNRVTIGHPSKHAHDIAKS